MKKFLICIFIFYLFCPVAAFSNEPIKIAAIFSKSGEAVAISIEHLLTVRFAVEELNTAGGLLGRRIELIEYDNQSSALGAKKAALKAVEDDVCAVIGGSWSSHAIGMSPVLQNAKIPTISPTATNPKLTRIGDYIFRTCFIDSFQGEMLAQFVHKDLNLQRVAVLTNVDQVYSIDLSSQFITSMKSFNREITAELEYIENLPSYDELISKLLTKKFDAVMLPGYTRDSAQIIKTARKNGINKIFVGGDGWSHLMLNYASSELNNSYYLTHWHKDLKDRKSVEFADKIVKIAAKSKVNAGMALSYDTVYLLADAILRAKSTEPEAIRDALAKTKDFIGVTGRIRYDRNRNPQKPAVILKFQDGVSTVVKRISL